MAESVVIQPMQWASTKDIHEVDPISDRDVEVLSEVRGVLLKHGALDRFGVMLIHKHFDLNEDEQMVEFTDVEKRQLTIQAMPASESPNTVETSWRFSADVSGAQPVAMCVYRCYFNNNATPPHASKHNWQPG